MINDSGRVVNHNVSSLGLSCSHWEQWLIQEVSIRPNMGQLEGILGLSPKILELLVPLSFGETQVHPEMELGGWTTDATGLFQ